MNPFLATLMTTVAAFVGIWFGSYLTQGHETQKWRRDEALKAYSQFVEAVNIVVSESDRIYVGECSTEEYVKQYEIILNGINTMDRISQRVFLLAPTIVNERASALTDQIGKEVVRQSTKCPKTEKSERGLAITNHAELLSSFRNTARNDLDIHPPRHTLEEWLGIMATEKPWW